MISEVFCRSEDGGAEGIRTPDPHNAIVVLYQLSYDPVPSCGGQSSFRPPNLSKRFSVPDRLLLPLAHAPLLAGCG